MHVKIKIVDGPGTGKVFRMKLPLIVGRGAGASVKLRHTLVSRHHCELCEDGGRVMLRDLGSLNGTLVDGQRAAYVEVSPSQRITVGGVTICVEPDLALPDEAVAAPDAVSPRTASTAQGKQQASPAKPAASKPTAVTAAAGEPAAANSSAPSKPASPASPARASDSKAGDQRNWAGEETIDYMPVRNGKPSDSSIHVHDRLEIESLSINPDDLLPPAALPAQPTPPPVPPPASATPPVAKLAKLVRKPGGVPPVKPASPQPNPGPTPGSSTSPGKQS